MKNNSEQVGFFFAGQLRKPNALWNTFHIIIPAILLFTFLFPDSVYEPISLSLFGELLVLVILAILITEFIKLDIDDRLKINKTSYTHCNFFSYLFIHNKPVSKKRLLRMKEQAREKGFDTQNINDFFNDFIDRFPDRLPTHAELNFHLQKILKQIEEETERMNKQKRQEDVKKEIEKEKDLIKRLFN